MSKSEIPRLLEALDAIKVETLVKAKGKKDLIFLYSNDTLTKAIDVLTKHGIQSAPVKDVVGKYWLGFLDVMDITTYILKIYCEGESGIPYPEIQWNKFSRDFELMEHKGTKYGNTPVRDVVGCASESYSETIPMPVFVPIPTDASVYSVVKWVLSQGHHRVAVYNQGALKTDITSVFTQSDVVQYLANNLALLGDYRNKSIEQLGLFQAKEVASISLRAPAIIALYVMYFNHVSSVAITHDTGEFFGAITPSDIKRIEAHNLANFLVPLEEFNRHFPGKLKYPVQGAASSSLESIITKMAIYRVHKVFILDHNKPIGVISTTDIMKWLVNLKVDFIPSVPSEVLSHLAVPKVQSQVIEEQVQKAQA